jgi:hypothetical protein
MAFIISSFIFSVSMCVPSQTIKHMRLTDLPTDNKPLLITSLAFGANQLIPAQYSYEGKDIMHASQPRC